jgi:hypothetical protein
VRGFRILMKLARPLYQSAEAGSLPLLFAATSPNARKGGYYGPDGWAEANGSPAAAFEPAVTKNAKLEDAYGMNQSGLQTCNS